MNKQINIVQQFNSHVRRFNLWREQKIQNNNIESFSFANDGGYVPISQLHTVDGKDKVSHYDLTNTKELSFDEAMMVARESGIALFDGQVFYVPRVVN